MELSLVRIQGVEPWQEAAPCAPYLRPVEDYQGDAIGFAHRARPTQLKCKNEYLVRAPGE